MKHSKINGLAEAVTLENKLHVIVQAGGRGSRLRHHTWNKPKCLVAVNGKPVLYHLFDRFPHAKFVIIGDYLFEQLKTYLEVNPPCVEFALLETSEKGTSSGVADALQIIPNSSPVLLAWSDLILKKTPEFPCSDNPVIFTTNAFTCRWTVNKSGEFHEIPSDINGIPGLFYSARAEQFPIPPKEGEFVKWFSKLDQKFEVLACNDIEEIGDFSKVETGNDREGFCRFFNSVEIDTLKNQVIKRVIDPAYDCVHKDEINWYEQATKLGFRRIPKVFGSSPLTMERICGIHLYNATDFTQREQRAVISNYLDALISLHDLGKEPSSDLDLRRVYIEKTRTRVESVSALIPMLDRETVTVNGQKCRNFFTDRHSHIFDKLQSVLRSDWFVPTHGDPTFSNSIVDDNLRVWFIDPRGSFAKPGIFGDAWYDFAKVYYSAVGGYDFFNRRKFKLHVDDGTVEVLMEPPIFADVSNEIFNDYFNKDLPRIKLLHGLIWLALSGYVKDDIDSIIGSFYLGLYWLEDGLRNL